MKRNREAEDVADNSSKVSLSHRNHDNFKDQRNKLEHPFKANFNDHFETNIYALRDIYPFVDELRTLTRPSSPESFTIYDPYFCTGKIRDTWKLPEFHVGRVIHENRDFYEDIKNGTAPPAVIRDEIENVILDFDNTKAASYDVCITNPPFSDNHIERFLWEFAIPSRKPWAMLVPDYIATKPWFINLIEKYYTSAPVIGRNVGFEKTLQHQKSSKGCADIPRIPVGLAMAAKIPRMIPLESNEHDAPSAPSIDTPPSDAQKELNVEKIDQPAPTKNPPLNSEESGVDTNSKEKRKGPNSINKFYLSQITSPICQEPFYIVPKGRYEFDHPVHAGRERSHFKSMWIVSGGRRTAELLKSVKARAETSKINVASGLVELTRQTASPGTAGSAALIPNPPKHKNRNDRTRLK